MSDFELYPDFKDLNKIISFIESEKINLSTQYISSLTGVYKSKFKSSGIIFDNIRKYQFGDDKRRIDWKASARTGKLYVKEFIEERNTEIMLVLNNSSEMLFASKYNFKSYIAVEIFSYIAFLALKNKDYVQPNIFTSKSDQKLFKHTNLKYEILEIIAQFSKVSQNKTNKLSNYEILKKLISQNVYGKNIYLIMPIFHDFDNKYKEIIKNLISSNKVTFIFIWDDLERKLPVLNNFEVKNIDNEHGYLINSTQLNKSKYQDIFDQKIAEINKFFRSKAIDHFYVNTKDNSFYKIVEFFSNK